MNKETVLTIINIVELVMKYGAPVVKSAIEAMNKDDITIQDIRKLYIEKEPKEYFPEKED